MRMLENESVAGAQEAWHWLLTELGGHAVPPLLVFIGFGNGDLLGALDRHAPATRVLALEPDAARAAAFQSERRWDTWRSSGRLVYLADPGYGGKDEAWRIFPTGAGAPAVLVHPEVTRAEGVARAAGVLKNILFGVEANAEARRRFAPRYLINSLRNIPAIVAGSDLAALANAYRGVPALIVAAGPSLDGAIPHLEGASDRSLLIAVDTALRPLLTNGIAPHLVVGLDPGASNLRHFLSLPECRDTWLVSESALDRQATAAFEGRTFWFRAANHHPWPWLNTLGIEAAQLDVWGSVLTAAFQTACLAGCDPIIVTGADLAFTDGRPYARGTTYEFDWAWSAAAGVDVASSWAAQIARAEPVTAVDLRGVETLTTPSLLSFRDWLVARAQRSGHTVINASGAGMFFGDGVEQMRLADALARRVDIASPAQFARRMSKVRPTAVAARLREVGTALAAGKARAPLTEWAEFSGQGFDPSAIGAALEEAAHTLGTRRGTPESRRVIDWSLVATADSTRGIIARLSEGVTRFRAGLRGGELPEIAADVLVDHRRRLDAAAQLLDDICEALSPASGAAASVDVGGDATAPVSATYSSPETIRWAIQVFEALLGHAWLPSACPPESPFFSATVRPRDSVDGSGTGDDRSHAARVCGLLASQLARCAGETDRTVSVALVGGASEAQNARRLTGTLRTAPQQMPAGRSLRFLRYPLLKRPRVLTDDGFERSDVSYTVHGRAVIVTPYSQQSVLVRPGGATEPHLWWPRPIVGELPFGDGGAVAWGNGMARWPDTRVEAPYVMYRNHPDDEVRTEVIPVRPTFGTWWEGRLYWNCYPTPIDSWTGIASWAPEQVVRLDIPGVLLFGMHVESDALKLEPCVFTPLHGFERRALSQGWRWRPGGPLEATALAAQGPVSCRVVGESWTAVAHPESDLVTFESKDGRSVAMTCYYPLRLAWAGGSLLVSTAEREVLLFEDVVAALDRAIEPEEVVSCA